MLDERIDFDTFQLTEWLRDLPDAEIDRISRFATSLSTAVMFAILKGPHDPEEGVRIVQ